MPSSEEKPKFNPEKPFQVADEKPAFDPKKPFEVSSEPPETLAESFGKSVLGGIAKAARAVDSITGAPVRAAIGKLQTGEGFNVGEALSAAKHQFAENPDLAPTGKQLAQNTGLSPEETINTGLYINPFSRETVKLSPAGIGGTIIEAATDPLSYVGGKPFELLGKGAVSAAEKVGLKASEELGHMAEQRAVKAATGNNASAARQVAGVTIKSAGDASKAERNISSAGRAMLEEGVLSPIDRAESLAPKLEAAKDKYGEMIGAVGQEMDSHIKDPVIGESIAARLRDYAKTFPQTVRGKNLAKRVEEEAKNIEQMGHISFADAQALKNDFAYKPTDVDALISNQDITNKIRGIISDEMDNTVEHFVKNPPAGINPELLSQYDLAKKNYGIFKKLSDAATNQVVKKQGVRSPFSLTDYITGGGAAATAASLTHNPEMTALISGIASVSNKLARERGNSLAARSLDAMSKALASSPELAAKYGGAITNALNYGPDSLVVTHHLLENNDPQYKNEVRKYLQTVSDSPMQRRIDQIKGN